MNIKDKIFYGTLLVVLGAAAYLSRTKEMVSQHFIECQGNNGSFSYVARQKEQFHPFRNLRFPAPTKYVGVVCNKGEEIKRTSTLFPSKARGFVRKHLKLEQISDN